MADQSSSLTYKDAGVDIDAGNALVDNIKSVVKQTHRPEVMTGLGGFGALFQFDSSKYKEPILVSGTDGVGTKLKLAHALNKHDTIGIDLVAMCVNDLIVCGAEPLFFLDYFATGQLDVNAATDVIKGIAEGCQQSGCALVGGETAEMPGLYQNNDYDLAGFCVGVVEKSKMITADLVQPGDKLIGLASSGPHSNGYSLIRKIIEQSDADLSTPFASSSLGETLLEPTKIYVKALLHLIKHCPVHAMAHITGGGFYENIPRVLPDYSLAHIDKSSLPKPEIFQWLQQQGQIDEHEMFRTFNCGIGMILAIPADQAKKACELLQAEGESAFIIGEIQPSEQQKAIVEIK